MLTGSGRRLSRLAGSTGHCFPAVEAAEGTVSQPRLFPRRPPGWKSKEVLSTVVVLGCLGMKEGLLLDDIYLCRTIVSLELAGLPGFLTPKDSLFRAYLGSSSSGCSLVVLTCQCFSRLRPQSPLISLLEPVFLPINTTL